ncbi:MAG: hypothetical protein GY703_01120 [Gammaproteobacteria bacterium]|nr:hypothetical protein [Gammaproteobacteria bacterium]
MSLWLTGCGVLAVKERDKVRLDGSEPRRVQACDLSLPLERTNHEFGGHRGGCEAGAYSYLPENSLLCLEAGLKGLNGTPPLQEQRRQFSFLEFDVRQGREGELIIYHGGDKGKLFIGEHATIPYSGINREIFARFQTGIDARKVKVRDLTADQIQQLYLGGDYCQRVPAADEYMVQVDAMEAHSAVMVDIKDVSCNLDDTAASPAHRLVDLISGYERQLFFRNHPDSRKIQHQRVGFILYKGRIRYLGGASSLSCWCKALKHSKLRVYKAGKFELMDEVMGSCI